MRNIPDTQIESYKKLEGEGLSKKLVMVRRVAIRRREVATFQIAEELGWPMHCVSGKVTVLCALGKMRDTGRTVWNPKTNRNCILWEACDMEPVPKKKICPTCKGTGHVAVDDTDLL